MTIATHKIQKCDYCYAWVEQLSKPKHLRQTDGRFTERTYLLCPGCKAFMRGNYRNAPEASK